MQTTVIDSHQHFWDLDLFNYEWMSPTDKILYRNFLPADFSAVRAENPVAGVVAVQAHQSLAETKWLLGLAEQYDFIKGAVGWVDLHDEKLAETLAELARHPKMKGVRHIVQDEPDDNWILRPEVIRGIRLLARFGLSYDILIFPRHLPNIPQLVEQCPETAFVVDHLAKPQIAAGEIMRWKQDLARVAAFPQVFCKLSGLVTEADRQNWEVNDLRPYADAALELFGPERLMFGSDYPVCLLASDYGEVLKTYGSLIDGLSANDREKILSKNAARFYRL